MNKKENDYQEVNLNDTDEEEEEKEEEEKGDWCEEDEENDEVIVEEVMRMEEKQYEVTACPGVEGVVDIEKGLQIERYETVSNKERESNEEKNNDIDMILYNDEVVDYGGSVYSEKRDSSLDERVGEYYTESDIVVLSKTFPLLQSYLNNPCVLLILEYLTAVELIQIASVSRGFRHTSDTPMLWKECLRRDFKLKSNEEVVINGENDIKSLPILKPPLCKQSDIENDVIPITASKAYYVYKWKGLNSRIDVARNRCDEFKKELKYDKSKMKLECCLDFTLVRVFVPFLLASTFTTMLLIAMWIDGNLATNVFVCFSPFLAFLFIYLSVVV